MRFFKLSIALIVLSALIPVFSFGQMVGDCIFFKGKHVEIGIAPDGAYGSTVNAPAGFHNDITQSFYDPATASTTSVNTLGFVADPDLDGWSVGTPNYFGDYYMPGTPQEGWAISVNGVLNNAFMTNYWLGGTSGFDSGFDYRATAVHPTILNGYSGTGSGTVSYSSSGTKVTGVWKGSMGNLQIIQTTTLDTNKLFFTVSVELKNTGSSDLNDIYYLRTVDPDNDEVSSGSFSTNNTITYALPNPDNKVLVSTTGSTYTRAYLGLGTKDCRAVCFILSSGLLPSNSDSISSLWNGTASDGIYTGEYDNDVGIGLVFNVGTIAAGDSAEVKYAYILREADLDSALDATEPDFVEGGIPHSSVDTINACAISSDTVTIENGGYYQWSWSPSTGLSDTTGLTNVFNLDSVPTGTVYTVTGTTTGGSCAPVVFTITVVRSFVPAVATNDGPVCQGDTLTLNAEPSGPGATYSWTGPGGFLSSSQSPQVTDITPSKAGTYSVVVNVPGCSASGTATTTVTVRPTPVMPSATSPVFYCPGAMAIPLKASGTGTLEWYTVPTGGTSSTTAPTPTTTTTDTTLYYVSQIVTGCESPRTPVKVIVYQAPQPAFSFTTGLGCTFDTVVFSNNSQFSNSYLWSFGDTTLDSNAYSTEASPVHYYRPMFYHDTSYTVTLYAYDNGCIDSTSQTVNLGITPGVTLINVTPDQSVAFGSSLYLNAEGAYRYFWTPDNGTLDDPNIHNPLATPQDSTTYTVYGYSVDGCLDSAMVHIGVTYSNPEIIPSAFTPNGDGLNDVFRVANIKDGKLLDFRVFDRWGQLIYHSTDVNKGWDGTLNGAPQDMGVYTYLIIISHADGAIKYYKGDVTLIR